MHLTLEKRTNTKPQLEEFSNDSAFAKLEKSLRLCSQEFQGELLDGAVNAFLYGDREDDSPLWDSKYDCPLVCSWDSMETMNRARAFAELEESLEGCSEDFRWRVIGKVFEDYFG